MAYIPAVDVLNSLKPGEIPTKDAHGNWMSTTPQNIVTTSQEADPKGTAASGISNHKSESTAHAIAQIQGLQNALNAKQALSTILSAIDALTTAGILEIKTDKSVATLTVTDAARSILDDATIPAIRTTLGLGNAALLNVGTAQGTVAAGDDPRLAGTGGTVKSVAIALPTTVFDISGSPVTSSGTLTGSLKTQAPALVFASPATGVAAAPTFRALAASDIPQITAAKISDLAAGTWTDLPLSNGWTNPLLTMAAGYIKLSVGLVMIRGQISKLTKPTSGETIATLPVGFRPSSARRFLSANNSNSSRPLLEINPTTGVISYGDLGTIPSTIDNLILSPIIFFAG